MTNSYITPSDFENPRKILKWLPKQSEEYWLEGVRNNAFKVFEILRDKIPFYKEFLKEHGVEINDIKNSQDIDMLPVMTKENYLNKFGLEGLLNGKVEDIKSFYMSSGSSGKPGVWPRLEQSNLAYAIFVNFFYTLYWDIDVKKTLYISAMDLGIWASGNLQFHAATYCAHRHRFTFANSGADFSFIYHILKELGSYYDQVIIATYPSWARRVLDYLLDKKDIDLKKLNIKLMLGGEPHTIEWRQFILKKIGHSEDGLTDVMDYYGTSDSGGPGSSTLLSTLIQNLCEKDNLLCNDLFGQPIVPSLFQQNPTLYVEAVNGNIVITYPGQLPLCRYDSGDTGGVIKFSEVIKKLEKHDYDINGLMSKYGYKNFIWKWPFVYLTGRYDLAINIGGAIVYPKDIEGLFFGDETKEINSFKLAVESGEDQKYSFKVYLELKHNIILSSSEREKLIEKYTKIILNKLVESNLDYAAAYDMDKDLSKPDVNICNYREPPFESEEIRQKPLFVKKYN
ncbi:hypothetical protein A3A76_04280 [Candidatus Woesebacteria bacterium RIFCSPLOWO2_01_FULL_39_23]|uniref:AMP-dependent synthetase/ligase domain-containing protein n=1 Tax=Candidatus Woesebacteria bacterium RIFCSPHIGHO2_01_FULL_40_22 TaxID=1802499 RepID=A0A1F7YFM4_9BACT|nr:MAG: hypothetical protein A2141_01845 [Candidatus Woesebacteria bacterium RBG_16_40_11]OGM25970.1 MAG: hypothetical protein A2628_00280 [Candidatus Woesebacteria bacterium RIFCSPHIGHO2_01_FULL_40_22]OGM38082.1 MAG: hypothetical protein A3E41_03365 [Candidatus Woesebacteria bacterium RIFCSPHIGHO2_12_FULL_38_9]OGM61819.1 MAG: hypothetical protein A3A76_04280 [Candidatus Woesebacteria bacterium RIFCSPLOWO2_01_FULL_39_23]